MAFHEVRFPTAIAFHSTGGPGRKTEIVALGSGYEERNAVWANSRRAYNVGYGIKSLDDLHEVIAFFEARMGRLYGFRLKDFTDWKSCAPSQTPTNTDQSLRNTVTGLGTGDGSTKTFQLQKTYSDTAGSYTRSIAKPVNGTVLISKAGVAQTTGWTIDNTTGLVTFSSAPLNGAAIKGGFQFDTPVRFDTDTLAINLEGFAAGDIPSIPLVELRL